MPIYEYQCQACGERHDALQKFSEGALRKCPACGKLRLKKLVSAAAFHLKGTGWYVTDFRDKGKTKEKGDGEGAKSTPADKSTESTADTKAESKPDAKSESKTDTKSASKKQDTAKSKPSKSA